MLLLLSHVPILMGLPGDTSDDTIHNCTINYCTGTSAAAATEVNNAIDLWLTPLRTPYGTTNNPIVSNTNTSLAGTYTSGGKTTPDLTIKFMCSDSFDTSTSNGTCILGNTSCTVESWKWPYYDRKNNTTDFGNGNGCGYNDGHESWDAISEGTGCALYRERTQGGDECTGGNCEDIVSLKPQGLNAYNQPVIYIGDDGRAANDPSKAKGYDEIEEHDRLDLIHEIGHAFGLADTHRANGTKVNKQPRAIMARDRIFERGDAALVLSKDDKMGIQWLYEHHRRGVGISNCHFQNEYANKDYTGTPAKGCEPKYNLVTALKDRDPVEAISIIDTDTNLNINAKETSTGHTALHYAILQYASPNNTATETADYLTIIRKIIAYNGVNLNVKESLGKDTAASGGALQ